MAQMTIKAYASTSQATMETIADNKYLNESDRKAVRRRTGKKAVRRRTGSLQAWPLTTAKEDWDQSLCCPWADEIHQKCHVFNARDCDDWSPSAPSTLGGQRAKDQYPPFLQNTTNTFWAAAHPFHFPPGPADWSMITAVLCWLVIPVRYRSEPRLTEHLCQRRVAENNLYRFYAHDCMSKQAIAVM